MGVFYEARRSLRSAVCHSQHAWHAHKSHLLGKWRERRARMRILPGVIMKAWNFLNFLQNKRVFYEARCSLHGILCNSGACLACKPIPLVVKMVLKENEYSSRYNYESQGFMLWEFLKFFTEHKRPCVYFMRWDALYAVSFAPRSTCGTPTNPTCNENGVNKEHAF